MTNGKKSHCDNDSAPSSNDNKEEGGDDDEVEMLENDESTLVDTSELVARVNGSKGVVVTPANRNPILPKDSEEVQHEQMMHHTRDKRRTAIKTFVKEKLFHCVKFINNEAELEWDYHIFGVKIMDELKIPMDAREEWWEDNKRDAKKALQERRWSITGAMKTTAKGKHHHHQNVSLVMKQYCHSQYSPTLIATNDQKWYVLLW